MKTENSEEVEIGNNAVIWDGSELHLSTTLATECLPIIGSSQVSSILSTLDVHDKNLVQNIEIPQIDLIVLQNTLIPKEEPNAVANKNDTRVTPTTKTKKKKKKINYITCNLCPFMCLKDKKIDEHRNLVHKNNKPSQIYEMKCPACPNIFYHKLSLQSHLTYDHCVTNTADIARIIQVALHTKTSVVFALKELPLEIDLNNTPIIMEGVQTIIPQGSNCKMEIVAKEADESDGDDNAEVLQSPRSIEDSVDEVVDLPTLEMSQNNAENLINSYIKKPLLAKYLTDKKIHRCSVPTCKVRMTNLKKLNYHVSCHAESSYKCPECTEKFQVWQSLSSHLWRLHKIDMELYCCDQCDYRTYSLSKLNNTHKLIHSNVKAYGCDECPKTFKNAKQLRNHKDTHKSTNSTFACDECEKTFFHKHLLKNHIDTVHKKLKPFLCNYCGYKGGSRGALRMHIRQHTGEKPFICDTCEYTCSDHNSLRRHKFRHSGEKPYKCTQCDYQCIQSSTYKIHIKTKHPGLDKELLFSCPICQFRSINKEVYNLHLTSQHPDMR